jgi:mitochondrial inner membrane protein COX18
MKTPFQIWHPAQNGSRVFCLSSRPLLMAQSPWSPVLSCHSPVRQRRSFHVGLYFNSGCQAAHETILSLHEITGLSWGLTIPLVAVGVNLLSRLPFNIYTQRIIQRRSQVAPVLQGWFMKLWRQAIRENVPSGQLNQEVEKRAKLETSRIYRALGLQQWKMFSVLLGFPFWIISLEAVRRICGWSQLDPVLNSGASAGEPQTRLETLPDKPRIAASDGIDVSDVTVDTSAAANLSHSAAHVGSAAQVPDPALTTEGMLWFTDLTAVDPYYVLPVCFTGLMLLNLIPRDEVARRAVFGRLIPLLKKDGTGAVAQPRPPTTPSPENAQLDTNWRVRLVRGVMLCSPGLLIITANFPAGMHLYTLTSLLMTMGTRQWLTRILPVADKTKTCKHREMTVIRPAAAKRATVEEHERSMVKS